MAGVHRSKVWNGKRIEVTPESAYRDRRAFLKAAGLAGLGALGLTACRRSEAGPDDMAELRASL